MEKLSEFSKRLRELREREGISQRKLSHLCGFPDSTIWKYENGKVEPAAKSLAAIADHFGVSMDYLWGEKNIDNCS